MRRSWRSSRNDSPSQTAISRGRQAPDASGGELDRQRHAVEAVADAGDVVGVALAEREARLRRGGRSTNSRTDSERISSAGVAAPSASGSVSGGTRQTISPVTCSGSRLVASTCSSGQPRSSASVRWAQAVTRWSQLSSTISASASASAVSSASTPRAPLPSSRPMPAATASAITSGSDTGASSISQTPSRKSSRRRAAISRPSRVLPAPPARRA